MFINNKSPSDSSQYKNIKFITMDVIKKVYYSHQTVNHRLLK